MAGPQTIWGIDVGKCALKALKLRMAPDKSIEVVAADYIEHAKIMSQQEADKDALWSAALQRFLSRNDISSDKVVVSVPGQQTLARFSKLPPVEKKKIPDIVRYEADQQIPFDMDEVVWDYQVFQVPDSPEVEVGIFAIKHDLIRDHLLRFEAGGIEPMAVQSAPLALYNGMQFDGAIGEETVVLVDIGTENTDLLVATENSLWTRTINVGGNNFTEALVNSFKLSFSKAEALKRTAATSKYARQIFQAMRPIFADLVQELQRSLGFYSATHRDAELNRVIGLGSAFKLPGLQKFVQQNLQLNLKRLQKFEKITIPETAEGGSDQAASFAVAYGLALQGLSVATVTSNLLPPEIVKQVVWRKKRPFFVAAAACLLLAAGTIWFRSVTDRGTLAGNVGEADITVPDVERAEAIINNPPANKPPREHARWILVAAKKLQSEYGRLSSQGDEETKKIETITGLLESRAVWLEILSVVHAALPQPNESLSKAANAHDYLAALEEAGIRRPDRAEIFVDSLQSEYKANVDEAPITDDWTGEPTEVIPNKEGKSRPGFLITMRCRTPNKDTGVFVTNTLVKSLQEKGRVPQQGFYINRVGVTSATEAKESGTSGGSGRDRGRGRGRGRGRPGEREEPSAQVSTNKDPLTRESMDGDWTFQIKLDVVLEDLPETKEEQKEDKSGDA